MFGFLALGLRAIVGIGNVIADAKSMSSPSGRLEDGTPYYYNRKNEMFINDEKVISKIAYKPDGDIYLQRVGARTGKVYVDPYLNQKKKAEENSERNKQMNIKYGFIAYMHFHPIWKTQVTREISSGKYIGELIGNSDGRYFVRYLDENARYKPLNLEWTEEKEITQDEYEKLNIPLGSHFSRDDYRYIYEYDCKKGCRCIGRKNV